MIPVGSVASIVRPGGAAMVGRATSPALARTGEQARLQLLWAAYTAHGEYPRHSSFAVATTGSIVSEQSRYA
jgi:hypothetical protein